VLVGVGVSEGLAPGLKVLVVDEVRDEVRVADIVDVADAEDDALDVALDDDVTVLFIVVVDCELSRGDTDSVLVSCADGAAFFVASDDCEADTWALDESVASDRREAVPDVLDDSDGDLSGEPDELGERDVESDTLELRENEGETETFALTDARGLDESNGEKLALREALADLLACAEKELLGEFLELREALRDDDGECDARGLFDTVEIPVITLDTVKSGVEVMAAENVCDSVPASTDGDKIGEEEWVLVSSADFELVDAALSVTREDAEPESVYESVNSDDPLLDDVRVADVLTVKDELLEGRDD